MHLNCFDYIVKVANDLVVEHNTRSATVLAEALDMIIVETPFQEQKGVYIYFKDRAQIFLNQDLSDEMRNIVILHEIGHHLLHREIASTFHETTLFDVSNHNMEYEANLFAA